MPSVVDGWPAPRGTKQQPANWWGTAEEYTALMHRALAAEGSEALALMHHDGRRTPDSHLTRWWAPGVPMHYAGSVVQDGETTWHAYLVPAQAALSALADDLIRIRPRRTQQVTP